MRNAANLLTGSRVILSFVFLYFVAEANWRVGLTVFVVAAFTDLIDGSIARWLNQRTQLGAILDGASDKLLILFGFLALSWFRFLPIWLTVLVILKDLMVSGGILTLRLKRIPMNYSSSILSKANTSLLFLVLTLGLIHAAYGVGDLAYGYDRLLAGLLTVFTTIQYFQKGLKLLKGSHASD
jgi:cardiolipin synthase